MQRDSRGGKGDLGGEFTRTLDRSQDTLLRDSGFEKSGFLRHYDTTSARPSLENHPVTISQSQTVTIWDFTIKFKTFGVDFSHG